MKKRKKQTSKKSAKSIGKRQFLEIPIRFFAQWLENLQKDVGY